MMLRPFIHLRVLIKIEMFFLHFARTGVFQVIQFFKILFLSTLGLQEVGENRKVMICDSGFAAFLVIHKVI